MNVACAKVDGLFEKVIDCAHDRRAAREIAQRVDALLDDALRIGNQAEPIAPDKVVGRMQRAKRPTPEPQAA